MPKVLIVDDEEDILWGLSEELSRNGIDVDTASNGQEAFDKIKENDYDFLITDIRMPGMSGSELLLKTKKLRPDLKVVVMTAYGSDELKQEVLSHGAVSYLEKPFDFEQLLQLIKEKDKKVDETISKLSLNQFMQLVSMEGQSCIVTVKTDEGEGKIYFIDGEVVNAEFQNLSGEDAFIKIMKFQNPAFDVEWTVPQTKRLIEKPLHALLLAAVAKKEEEEAGVKPDSELGEEEVDLSALSQLFGEDEGVAEESVVDEEEVVEEEGKEEPTEEELGLSLESLSLGEEEVLEEEVEGEEEKVELPEEIESEAEKEVVEEKEEELAEEEFSLENLESMLEEEVEGEEEKVELPEEIESEAEKEVVEEKEEELAEEEFKEETPEEKIEEKVEVAKEGAVVEEKIEEKIEEPAVSQVEQPLKEEAKTPEVKEEVKAAPVVSEDKVPVINEALRKIVALTTDVHAGFVADIGGNVIASHFRSGNIRGDKLGNLGEYTGKIVKLLKEMAKEDVEDITIALKNENIMAAPALGGDLIILVVTSKRTLKLALIKVELRKAIAKLNQELS